MGLGIIADDHDRAAEPQSVQSHLSLLKWVTSNRASCWCVGFATQTLLKAVARRIISARRAMLEVVEREQSWSRNCRPRGTQGEWSELGETHGVRATTNSAGRALRGNAVCPLHSASDLALRRYSLAFPIPQLDLPGRSGSSSKTQSVAHGTGLHLPNH